jgi:hypothetical protein
VEKNPQRTNAKPKQKKTNTLRARETKAMQGPIHTAAEWAQIARESKAEDLWCNYRLTRLSNNQIALLNEQGFRCRQDSCSRYVEFQAEKWTRGYKGVKGHHATEYQCARHARGFAQENFLDWPCRNEVPDELPAEGVIEWNTNGKRGSS